jgi:hypothetical protein
MKHDYSLSEEYQKNHFLTGLLLTEVKSALNEVQDIRKFAIKTLRNLLAKHAFDDRYASKVCMISVFSFQCTWQLHMHAILIICWVLGYILSLICCVMGLRVMLNRESVWGCRLIAANARLTRLFVYRACSVAVNFNQKLKLKLQKQRPIMQHVAYRS